jgi:stringent starvation protein B
MQMTSSRPYLIRAIHQWIVDNSCTPYVLVNASAEGVSVPQQHVENGKIILNLSPRAVRALQITNEAIEFETRFGGVATLVQIPSAAVLAIYARENGQGMIFDKEEDAGPRPPSSEPPRPQKPKLRVVK